jgi:hypothetical protein
MDVVEQIDRRGFAEAHEQDRKAVTYAPAVKEPAGV